MTSWRVKLFWSALVVLYAAWAARRSYDLVRPAEPAAVVLTVVIARLVLRPPAALVRRSLARSTIPLERSRGYLMPRRGISRKRRKADARAQRFREESLRTLERRLRAEWHRSLSTHDKPEYPAA